MCAKKQGLVAFHKLSCAFGSEFKAQHHTRGIITIWTWLMFFLILCAFFKKKSILFRPWHGSSSPCSCSCHSDHESAGDPSQQVSQSRHQAVPRKCLFFSFSCRLSCNCLASMKKLSFEILMHMFSAANQQVSHWTGSVASSAFMPARVRTRPGTSSRSSAWS